jgi:hypothetical protein
MVLLHELDMHYCDPLTAHVPLGGVDRAGRRRVAAVRRADRFHVAF